MTMIHELPSARRTRPTTWPSLRGAIRRLTSVEENGDLVVSLTFPWSEGRGAEFLERRAKEVAATLEDGPRVTFLDAVDAIRPVFARGFERSTEGIAVYARAGANPFLVVLPFAASLPKQLLADHAPHILPLVELKDSYHRFVVLVTTEASARILELSLGAVTQDVWAARRTGGSEVVAGWLRRRYESQRSVRRRFVAEKLRVLEDVVRNGRHTHLILTGDPVMVAMVRRHLTPRLKERLIDTVRLPERVGVSAITARTLEAFLERERRESVDLTTRLERELRRDGLAVAGARATLEALVDDRVDVLLLAADFAGPSGWRCGGCARLVVDHEEPARCATCGARTFFEHELREQLVRLAERNGRRVELVRGCGVIERLGGVGALLRFRPVEY